MEYYETTVTEQPARQPVPIRLLGAALTLGIVGFVLSLITYFLALFGNIWRAANYQYEGMPVYGPVLIVLIVLAMLLGAAAVVLGVLGLIRSIRRATRSVKGIVFSAVGLCLGIGALTFALICIFITWIFSVIVTASGF